MIQNENYYIRPLEKSDISTLYAWNSNSIRGDFQEATAESIHNLTLKFEEGQLFSLTFQTFIVTDMSPSKKPTGVIYLNFIREGLVRIGVVLHQENRAKGLGKSVTRDITHYLFQNFPLVRIEAETDINNTPAQRALESVGFAKEGILKKYRFHHGIYHDSVLYSLIR